MNVINRLKNRYWFVLKNVWNICVKPDKTLKREELMCMFENKDVFKNSVLPMTEMLMTVGFISSIFRNGTWQPANALASSLFVGIIFMSSYGVIYVLERQINKRLFNVETSNRDIEIMVISLMSVTFIIKMIQLIMPDLFFITFFYIYLLYLVWQMSGSIIQIPEEKRNRYMVIISMIVVAIPWIIKKIMMLMVPNLLV